MQSQGLYERSPPENPGEEYSVTIFDEGETIHEHAQPEDFTPSHPDMLTLITNSINEEPVIDKHTFQAGKEDLPKPHIQYTPTKLNIFR